MNRATRARMTMAVKMNPFQMGQSGPQHNADNAWIQRALHRVRAALRRVQPAASRSAQAGGAFRALRAPVNFAYILRILHGRR